MDRQLTGTAPPQAGLRPLAVYVHWPWCKAKCPYCDFNSHAGEIREKPYVEGLLREVKRWGNGLVAGGKTIPPAEPASRRIESVFFGGGTPSLMSAGQLARVIDACHGLGVVDDTTEVTVECNPTSFGDARKATDFFADLRAAGVNRVSIGVQGLKPEWLAFLGRQHQVEDALQTLDAALGVFDNVNADVIHGLPGQRVEDWLEQLEKFTVKGLSHISAYQLTIEANTQFFSDVRKGLWTPIPSDLEADFFEATQTALKGAGYVNYEISNFARPGRECRHNVHVWRYGEYLGIGAGAHGRVETPDGGVMATQVIRQPEGYLRRMEGAEGALSQAVALDAREAVQEAVFSGLRLAEGVDVERLRKRFGEAAYAEAISASATVAMVAAGLLVECGTILRLSADGWPKLNGILQRILTRLPQGEMHPAAPSDTPADEYTRRLNVTIL